MGSFKKSIGVVRDVSPGIDISPHQNQEVISARKSTLGPYFK